MNEMEFSSYNKISYNVLDSVFANDIAEEKNLTSTENYYMFRRDFVEDKFIQFIFCLIYTAIFVIGLTGNLLVCYVVFRNKSMHTVTNLFITNLALSDILLCILAVPFTPLYTFTGHWVFGPVLCQLVPYAQGTSVYVSTLTLTSIAIDRFFVIIYPFRQRMPIYTCIGIITTIWITSILLTFPYFLYTAQIPSHEGKYYCEEEWPSETSRLVYGGITAILQFLAPFLVIAFCYTRVSIKLNDRARSKPGTKNTRKEEIDRERKKRTNRMLIAMVGIFGVCWFPINGINLTNDIYTHFGAWKYYYLVFFISHSLAMSSTCYNPFLYAWLNENFRKEFKQVLPCFKRYRRFHGTQKEIPTTGWKSERTCNGNETCQETLLPTSSVVFNNTKSNDNITVDGISGREILTLTSTDKLEDDAVVTVYDKEKYKSEEMIVSML